MTDLDYDVVVVGAGPAGSSCALRLAKKGVKVLVIEKKQEVGTPKRCAEGLNQTGLDNLDIPIDSKWAIQKITGAVIYTPSQREVDIPAGSISGYIVERKVFEKSLAAEAINHGARYMVKTQATGLIKKEGRITGVKAEYMGEKIQVKARIVIAADGVESMCAKWAGIDTVNKINNYHSGFQYEMAGVDVIDDKIHIFFGRKIAPRGYVWIFPKGDTIANVGIGMLGDKTGKDKSASQYLDAFIQDNPRFFDKASPIEVNSGGIPVKVTCNTLTADGLMLIGDAAQQVDPVHGGGIHLGIIAGNIAGDVAAEALAEDDVSGERLRHYEQLWDESQGKSLRSLYKVRGFIEKLEDDDIESMADILTSEDILKLTEGKTLFLAKVFARKSFRIMRLVKRFLLPRS